VFHLWGQMGQQVISLGPNENYERPGYAHIRKMTQKHRERLRKNFKKGRDLLLKKGVPFEPNDLLEHNWPKFTASAEMVCSPVTQGQLDHHCRHERPKARKSGRKNRSARARRKLASSEPRRSRHLVYGRTRITTALRKQVNSTPLWTSASPPFRWITEKHADAIVTATDSRIAPKWRVQTEATWEAGLTTFST
jgi:hypothetical protein